MPRILTAFLVSLLLLTSVRLQPASQAAGMPIGTLTGPLTSRAEEAGEQPAIASIREAIRKSGAEQVGLAVHDLATGRRLLIDERVSFHAASTMKVPVMMELFRLAATGQLRLTDRLPVRNSFTSIVDGSEFRLTAADDSDQEIYNLVGREMPILDLIDRMITQSSNLATNILIEQARPNNINQLARRLGAIDLRVLRGVEDNKAFRAGRNNTTTALDLMLLLVAIAEGRFIPAADCEKMIEILARQKFNDGIPAGLPKGMLVAHKTGEITRHKHDAAIVYPQLTVGNATTFFERSSRKPYVIVVLTRGIAESERSDRLIAEISSIVYRMIRPNEKR